MLNRYFIAIFSLLLFGNASAFSIPERLQYDLKWTGIKAGTAVLEIKKEDGNTISIISQATSAGWVSVFYRVQDRTESKVSAGSIMPLRYCIKLKEGKHRRDKEVIFDHKGGKVTYIDHLSGEKKEFNISGKVFDPLSGFFYLRQLPLEVGKSVYLPIFDSKKLWDVEVSVLRKEKIKTSLGTFDTIVIMPLMKSEGIFSREGDILIWLTDDEKRIPIRLKSKVKIGSITAELVEGKY
ncbi:MAG: DUF3108 domain-containing protein [Nitrospirae bacterium]|nr:DUF3108 domain-containing protein [Nitrospirota bacterium]